MILNIYIDPQALSSINQNLIARIAALLIGLVTWHLANQQRIIAHEKLRLDLFDKRFAIYSAVKRFSALLFSGNISLEENI